MASEFRVISLQEQKQLPPPIIEWVGRQKKTRGMFPYEWEGTRYLLLSLGQRPNPGYRLEVVSVEPTEHEVTVFIKELLPIPGRMYPQVIVYPYILAEVKGAVSVWFFRSNQIAVPFP